MSRQTISPFCTARVATIHNVCDTHMSSLDYSDSIYIGQQTAVSRQTYSHISTVRVAAIRNVFVTHIVFTDVVAFPASYNCCTTFATVHTVHVPHYKGYTKISDRVVTVKRRSYSIVLQFYTLAVLV